MRNLFLVFYRLYLPLFLLLTLAPATSATVTNVAWYRLGENDPGGVSGLAVTNTATDLVGANHLKQFNSPRYTNSVSAAAASRLGSSLSVNFNGTSQYLSNAIVSTAVNNFGMEAWVKPNATASGNRTIVCNGSPTVSGWAFIQHGGVEFTATLGGVTSFGSGTAVASRWTHLALVRDNGTTTFYVDGVASGTSVSNPIPAATSFIVAVHPQLLANTYFNGAIDEVRVFTFAAGQFSTNDLLFNLQRVATLPATAITLSNATLNGSANPDGLPASAWFEWGTTTNYGNVTPLQAIGTGSANFSQVIAALAAATAYHFRAVASNSLGTVRGTNQSFTTPVFTDIGAGLPGVAAGSAAWGDYDSDGRLDILLTGTNMASGQISQVWRNNGSGFTNIYSAGFFFFYGPGHNAVAWGDYDNDGRLDFLLAGSYDSISTLYRNTGSGFALVGGPALDGPFSASVAWGDYDNDGRSDILLTGVNSSGDEETRLWRNTANGFTNFLVRDLGLPVSSSVAWGDYDNDGWLDFVLTWPYSQLSPLWRNTGGAFTNLNFGLPAGGFRGAVAWGDYDNDGRLDILITGTTNGVASGAHSQVWRNTANGFTNINAGLPGVEYSSVAWGDYDNDGRLDILITGTTNDVASGAISQVWRNTGAGFSNINAGLPGVYLGSGAWGDYDNDGRLDILLTGSNATAGAICQIWRNNTPVSNTPPNAPTGLTAAVTGSMVTLTWNAANDAQTSASGLTYNLRVGTTPGAGDVLSSMSAANGFRRLPQTGNAQTRLFARLNVTVGTPYFWSVQAVDSSFAGSAFAAEGNFKLLQWEAPLIMTPAAATSLLVGDYNGNGVIDEGELNTVLANYFPNSPFLQMTNVAGLGGTNVTFALNNSTAGAFSVEYTTNFLNWLFLGPATPRYLFTDTNAPAVPQRYYRLRWP